MAFSQFLEYNKTTFSTEWHDILPQSSDNVTAICIHPVYLRLKNTLNKRSLNHFRLFLCQRSLSISRGAQNQQRWAR